MRFPTSHRPVLLRPCTAGERIPRGPYFCTVLPEIERQESVQLVFRWLYLLDGPCLQGKDFPHLLFPQIPVQGKAGLAGRHAAKVSQSLSCLAGGPTSVPSPSPGPDRTRPRDSPEVVRSLGLLSRDAP